MSLLALKHKKPEITLDILSTVKVDRVLSVRSLKIMAFTHLGRYVQIIPVMKYALEQEVGIFRPHLFFADVVRKTGVNLIHLDIDFCTNYVPLYCYCL